MLFWLVLVEVIVWNPYPMYSPAAAPPALYLSIDVQSSGISCFRSFAWLHACNIETEPTKAFGVMWPDSLLSEDEILCMRRWNWSPASATSTSLGLCYAEGLFGRCTERIIWFNYLIEILSDNPKLSQPLCYPRKLLTESQGGGLITKRF